MIPNNWAVAVGFAWLVLVGSAGPAVAQQMVGFPGRPGDGEFVADAADLIEDDDFYAIQEICERLETDTKVPLMVVTIESMKTYEARRWWIERYGRALFERYKRGFPNWNYGILVLVSEGDRKSHIHLGADWSWWQQSDVQKIMDRVIVPQLLIGNHSKGILEGVRALDGIARGKSLPKPWWVYGVGILGIILFIFSLVSFIRCGTSGWAWVFWGVLFKGFSWIVLIFLFVLGRSMQRAAYGRRYGGGGYGGGGGGGSFSGGGGSTGSW